MSSLLPILVFCLCLALSTAQNPCEPNPCGTNTRCLTQGGSSRPVISCKCLPGFRQGDPFSGCESITGLLDQYEEESFGDQSELESVPSSTSTTTTTTTTTTRTTTRRTTTTTTDRPLLFPTRPTVVGFNSDGQQVTLHEAQADLPRRFEESNNFVAANSNSPSELDLDKIFSEECLVSEDCQNPEYCDLITNKCKNACSLNICGSGAECKGRIHRPLCFCSDGYDGNPHVQCTKAKSRAGTRFRRNIFY